MPIARVYPSFKEAVADIPDGAVIMIDGFGGPGGRPSHLIQALRVHGARDLTIISNAIGLGQFGSRPGYFNVPPDVLIENGQVTHAIASFPVGTSAATTTVTEQAIKEGRLGLEVVPQGTLAERIRAGGAGIAAFYTPTGVGTVVEQGKEKRAFNGQEYLLERALRADFALVRAHMADPMGNLVYRGTSRTFNHVMATAARVTIVEVDELVEAGGIEAEQVHTPGIYVQRIVVVPEGGGA